MSNSWKGNKMEQENWVAGLSHKMKNTWQNENLNK